MSRNGHLEICCDYPTHMRHQRDFKRSKSYSAKKFNRELRIDSYDDIDVDADVSDNESEPGNNYTYADDSDADSEFSNLHVRDNATRDYFLNSDDDTSSDSDTPIIAVSQRDPSMRVVVCRLPRVNDSDSERDRLHAEYLSADLKLHST